MHESGTDTRRISGVALCLALVVGGCTSTPNQESSTPPSPKPPPSSSPSPSIRTSSCELHPVPSPTELQGSLNAVAVVSQTDAWAVGYYRQSHVGNLTLIEHWDGSSWSKVTSPGDGQGALTGISAASSSDIWAVGNGTQGALAEHWNGKTWSVVSTPSVGGHKSFSGVVTISAKDAWAVGQMWTGGNRGGGHYDALIEHWDGKRWILSQSAMPPSATALSTASPSAGAITVLPPASGSVNNAFSIFNGDNMLYSVDASSPNDVWAVGHFVTGATYNMLAEHWNGKTWTTTPIGDGLLNSVQVVSPTDVTAFGSTRGLSGVIERWNGRGWSKIASPKGNQLVSSDAESGSNIWIVGDGNQASPLVEHWNGHQWRIQNVALPSSESSQTSLDGIGVDPSTGWVVAVGQVFPTAATRWPIILDGCQT